MRKAFLLITVLIIFVLSVNMQVYAAPPTDKNIKVQLACVTATMKNPTENSADIVITNEKNIDVSDWSEVFNAVYIPPTGDIYWGLQCKDDWLNTGCHYDRIYGAYVPDPYADLGQWMNGCYSDDEEIEYLRMYVTCCKIVAN